MILDWRKFVLRSDVKNLPLEEQRRKFLSEQLYHDNLLSEQKQRQYEYYMSQMQTKGGPSGGGFSGQGIDGPIAGATVTSNVGTTTTNAAGIFKFPKKPSGPITLIGGTDAITGLPFEGELIGYPEYKTISPITTFAHYLKEATAEDSKVTTLTIDQAITQTFNESFEYFGIALPIEDKDVILQKDYIKEAIVNNNKIGISAQAVATQIESITETVGVALEGSNEAIAAKEADRPVPSAFSTSNRKRSAYQAMGRAATISSNLSATKVTGQVKYFDDGRESIGVEFADINALDTQLDQTKSELADIAKQEQYTNNYLTTRIQAVNRAQKTTIKDETVSAVNRQGSFSNINTVSTSKEVEDALKQIEKDKANETSPVLDGTPQIINNATFWQLRKGKSGEETYMQLRMSVLSSYTYFGTVKDLPVLMTATPSKEPGETTYSTSEFPNDEITDLGISLNSPVELRTSIEDKGTGITTNTVNTFRPFSSSKGKDGINVGLRLSNITVTQKGKKK